MTMSKFNRQLMLLLTLLVLQACQTRPAPAPEPAIVEAPATTPPLAQPVDLNYLRYDEAVIALKAGKLEEAIELLTRLSVDAPQLEFLFTNLGLAYFRLEQFEPAELAFQRAIANNDDDAVAFNHLGILQRQKGQFDEARKHYQRAIDIDQNYAAAQLNLGILFDIYFQDLDKALLQYQKYLALIQQEDTRVAGWIVDIERRIKPASTQSQG